MVTDGLCIIGERPDSKQQAATRQRPASTLYTVTYKSLDFIFKDTIRGRLTFALLPIVHLSEGEIFYAKTNLSI